MKHIKRFSALLLALALTLALSIPALAANEGSLTVQNTVKDTEYSIYRIFDLESYNGTNYSYTVNAKWAGFFAEGAAGLDYVEISNGYVTWKEGAKAAEFAAAALAYATAEDTKIEADAKKTSEADKSSVVFENLPLGYYLVDSSLGALCALTTTAPDGVVIEKNSKPGLDKQVKEDSTGEWGDKNDADIGQTVEFKATITVQGYAKDYVMHDKMEKGLTYSKVSKVTLNGTEVTAEGNYTVTAPAADGCTFDVAFSETFCNGLKSGDVIVVYYEAIVNEEAVVGLPGNPNDAYLEYADNNGETHETEKDETRTYTWDMDVLKYANGNKEDVLQGVEFVLLNSDKSKVATVVNGKLTGWVNVPDAVDGVVAWPENTVLTTDENGKIMIDGLDADTYYLREVKALEGYNVLPGDVTVTITGETTDETGQPGYSTTLVEVENKSGTELPSTGGMGTTVLYILGAALVLCAGVLLITRRRMSR